MSWARRESRPPEGFEWMGEGRTRMLVASPLVPAVRRSGLLAPGALEAALEAAQGSPGRAPTARLALPGRPERLVIRPVLHGGWLGRWLGAHLLGPGRPVRELATTASLRASGAPVPEPALVWTRRVAGPVWRAAVATVEVPGTLDGERFLRSHPAPDTVILTARAAGRAVRRFHDAGGVHADLHVKNLLVRGQDTVGPEVIVIDLDRARRVDRVSPRRRLRELMRLYRSLRKRGLLAAVGPRGLAAFFEAYTGSDRALRRALLGHLSLERLRVAIHALGYRMARRTQPPAAPPGGGEPNPDVSRRR